jgi:nucleoside-diphosphate-sugar epimerase
MGDVVLVTGASGLIGARLAPMVRAAGMNAVTHSRADGDIADGMPDVPGVTHVFHLAAKTFVPDSWISPAEFYRTNVLGTVNVLELCRREGASFTLVSSYVYANPPSNPIAETHPVRAINPYSHSKLMAEEIASYYARDFNVRVTIVRPFNIYGPGQASHFLIPKLLEQAISPECDTFTVEDARPKRDYLFVDDLCALLIRLMERGKVGIYNAGSSHSISVGQLAALVNRAAGTSKPVISRENYRPGEVLDVVADISKAKTDVGWEPSMSLEEGLRRTLSHMVGTGVAHGQLA